MNPLWLAVVLAIGWVAITGAFSLANLAGGAVIGVLVIFLLRHHLRRPLPIRRTVAALALALLFLRELLLGALRVAWLALQPDLARRLKPAIIAYPLQVTSDAEITLLANLITLTPGTLTVDASSERRLLYIHVLHLEDRDALIGGIASGFERKVIEVFQ
jgi:multicomponent Na+:H+ antiporter subunit E